jgi:transcriptional regulator with XRE-family HTH domain
MAVRPGRKKRSESRYAPQAAELASQLRALRVHAELTQEQLATRAGIALSTLRKIETGKVNEPGYFTIVAMLHALGVTRSDGPTTDAAESQ